MAQSEDDSRKGAKVAKFGENILTADLRRLSQIRIRTFHRRDAKYAKEILLAQSGDDDWAIIYISNLSNVFVCRRLPTNKKLILCALCALCASAVKFLKRFLSVPICVGLRLKQIKIVGKKLVIGGVMHGELGGHRRVQIDEVAAGKEDPRDPPVKSYDQPGLRCGCGLCGQSKSRIPGR